MDRDKWQLLMEDGARALDSQALPEAEEAFIQALTLAEQQEDSENLALIKTLTELAAVQLALRQYTEAEQSYLRALSLVDDCQNADGTGTHLLSSLGRLYYDLSEFDQAEPIYQRALEQLESELGAEHIGLSNLLSDLASVCNELSKVEEAEKLYLRVLKIKSKEYGEQYDGIETDIEHLATLYINASRYTEAEALYTELISGRERIYGEDGLELVNALTKLIEIKRAQDKLEEADPIYDRIISMQAGILGAGHPATRQIRRQQAIGYYMRALNHKGDGHSEPSRRDIIRASELGLDETEMQILNHAVLQQTSQTLDDKDISLN